LVELGYLKSAHTRRRSRRVQPATPGHGPDARLGSSREFVGLDALDQPARSGRG
jgi:hypothetical protein